jgi:hypothetical protein
MRTRTSRRVSYYNMSIISVKYVLILLVACWSIGAPRIGQSWVAVIVQILHLLVVAVRALPLTATSNRCATSGNSCPFRRTIDALETLSATAITRRNVT